MKYLLIILVLLIGLSTKAQQMEGVITYERAYHWSRIYSRLDFLSQEEKDRIKLTGGNNDVSKSKMKLLFTPTQSLYTYASDQGSSEDGTYSWRQDEYLIFRDFEKERKTEIIEMLGKHYLIEDTLQAPRWKVMNQIKDINGYVCMLATTVDTVKKHKVAAWFAHDLPVSTGPERIFGLPGMIMELDINDGDFVITAIKVELKPVGGDLVLPKKLKGKKLDNRGYDTLLWTHIKQSMEAHRNPYWSIPY
jgi:GLPGLI family protein